METETNSSLKDQEINMLQHLIIRLLADFDDDKHHEISRRLDSWRGYAVVVNGSYEQGIEPTTYILKELVYERKYKD